MLHCCLQPLRTAPLTFLNDQTAPEVTRKTSNSFAFLHTKATQSGFPCWRFVFCCIFNLLQLLHRNYFQMVFSVVSLLITASMVIVLKTWVTVALKSLSDRDNDNSKDSSGSPGSCSTEVISCLLHRTELFGKVDRNNHCRKKEK